MDAGYGEALESRAWNPRTLR